MASDIRNIIDHKVDPDGDVILSLQNPNAPFAIWDPAWDLSEFVPVPIDITAMNCGTKSIKTKKKKKRIHSPTLVDPDEAQPSIEDELSHPDFSSLFEDSPDVEDEQSLNHTSSQPLEELEEVAKMHLQLSSKHLTLSSIYFRKMLNGQWKESIVSSNSLYMISASEWDANALLILMNIIHGRVRRVPRIISLEMLAKIAVLVDYYECYEVVELHIENWIRTLKIYLPTKYSRELVLWLTISWVFSQEEIFETLTKVAMMESKGYLHTLDLPIPSQIVETINLRREDFIDDIISELHGLFIRLLERTECSFDCSSILSGALAKQMHINGLFTPKPTRPFYKYNATEIIKVVQNFQDPKTKRLALYHDHKCSLDTFMDPIVGRLADGIHGLALKDFQTKMP